ncbi:hypothetical protein DK60_2380 [Brucella canis]|nr:hypothetical protein DK60_2380 [Brucella canis]
MAFSCRRMESRLASTSPDVVVISSPSTVTLPLSMGRRRLTIESRVDFPAPLGPMIDVIPRAGKRSVTSSTTSVPL